MSATHTHTKLQRMSPKAIPSIFTYQDDDSDVDVAIQFFDKDDFNEAGEIAMATALGNVELANGTEQQ